MTIDSDQARGMNPKILHVAIGVLNTAPLRAMVRAAPGDGQRYDVLLETHWNHVTAATMVGLLFFILRMFTFAV